jgi:hypothetical protein
VRVHLCVCVWCGAWECVCVSVAMCLCVLCMRIGFGARVTRFVLWYEEGVLVCACMRACLRACMHACVLLAFMRACMHACVHAFSEPGCLGIRDVFVDRVPRLSRMSTVVFDTDTVL